MQYEKVFLVGDLAQGGIYNHVMERIKAVYKHEGILHGYQPIYLQGGTGVILQYTGGLIGFGRGSIYYVPKEGLETLDWFYQKGKLTDRIQVSVRTNERAWTWIPK